MEINLARFFAKVNKRGRLMPGMKTRCHEWTGWVAHGYGYFWLEGKHRRAHRVAFFIKHGRWPKPQALHRCDNPACVRFSHLREGTQRENILEMHAKNRGSSFAKGEKHPSAKLSDADIEAIRSEFAVGGVFQYQLAEKYGVTADHLSKIMRGKSRVDANC